MTNDTNAENNELSVPENAVAERPSFLPQKKSGGAGTETLNRVIVPPRLKLVQPQSQPPFTDQFAPGDLITVPQMVKICGKDEGSFVFVPIFFFAEYLAWNPIQAKGTVNAIRDRSLDINSEVAQKALDQKRREEDYPDTPSTAQSPWKIRYCEHLNFIVMPVNFDELGDTPIVMSFFRAEHMTGRNFASKIKTRQADIFGCQFEAETKYNTNNLGGWYGLDIHNPRDHSAWVEQEDRYKFYKELHEQYSQSDIQVDYEDSDLESGGASPDSTGEF